MSRKLMINNHSKNELSPVMDGLICWLDGRDYVTGENIWRDRSINKNNFRATGLSIDSKGAIYCESNTGGVECNLKTPMSYTIEVNGYYSSFDNISYLWTFGDFSKGQHHEYLWNYPDGNTLSLRRAEFNNYWMVYDHIYTLVKMKRSNLTIIFDYNSKLATLYVDGMKIKEMSFVSRYNYMNTNYCVLMNRGDKCRPFNNGGIYSYKIYDRVLNDDEIMQNYQYEQSIQRGDN